MLNIKADSVRFIYIPHKEVPPNLEAYFLTVFRCELNPCVKQK
jgi:hypothetical protein